MKVNIKYDKVICMNQKFLELLNEITNQKEIEFTDIPMIDLYMDQVITLFENKLGNSKRNNDDKLLTKTMINNYVKDKILLPAQNKKYSPEHLIMMVFIYNLKQNLAINDIKTLFTKTVYNEDVDLFELYKKFLEIKKQDQLQAEQAIMQKLDGFNPEQPHNIDIMMMVLSLINTANIQKRLAEKIIDNYLLGQQEKES